MNKGAGTGYFWLCLCTFCTAERTYCGGCDSGEPQAEQEDELPGLHHGGVDSGLKADLNLPNLAGCGLGEEEERTTTEELIRMTDLAQSTTSI